MDKISGDKVFSIHPLPDGFLYAYCIEKTEKHYKIGYKMVSFDKGKVSSVTKSIYMLTKFGADYKTFEGKIKNYLTCFSILMEGGQTFVIERDGTANIFGPGGEVLFSGTFLYQNTPPGGVAVNGNTLWVSYPEHNVLIRHTLSTLREELRIGGKKSPKKSATALFAAGTKLFICSRDTNSIWKMDVSTYQTELYYEFDEPALDYIFINKYEIAVLESGIYLL